MAESLWTIRDVARYLQLSERTIYRLPLRYVVIAHRRRYDPADVRLYVSTTENRAPLMRVG